jgi:hypothetical protein
MAHQNTRVHRGRSRIAVTILAAVSTVAGIFGTTALPAHATVGQTYACGYWANVNFFGGGYKTQGCAPQTDPGASANSLAPSVTLPAAGGSVSATDADGARALFSGVANIFSSPYDPNDNLTNSGQMDVLVQGTSSAVLAQAKAQTVGPSPFWTRSPSSAGPYAEPAKSGSSYDGSVGYVLARCSGSGSTETGTVVIQNGFVDTATDSQGYPTQTVAVPTMPAQGYRVDYTLNNVGDHGYIIFNERIDNPDGTTTINGVHMYMQGQNAFGDLIIAKTVCGVS